MPAVATSRIGARINPDLHQLLKRAAQIQGRTLSDFLIASARESAVRAIQEHDLIHVSLRDQEHIARALLAPPKANAALRHAMSTHDTLIAPAAQ